jgi:hypothetical protein
MASKLKLTELLYPTSTTAAITINSDDSVTIPTQSTTNLAYTGTLTGGTGVVNLGSGQIYKDASGNVGIGTSSPAQKLEVTAGNAQVQNTNTPSLGATLPFGLTFRGNNQVGQDRGTIAAIKPFLGSGADNDFGLVFQTQASTGGGVTTKVTLTPSGFVGIGTTPTFQLDVSHSGNTVARVTTTGTGSYGALRIENTNTNSEASIGFRDSSDSDATSWVIGKSVNAADVFGWYYGGARMTLDTSGNLLVGRTAARSTEIFSVQANRTNFLAEFSNSATSGSSNVILAFYPNYSPNSTLSSFFRGADSTVTRFDAYSNGGIANYQANNVNLSDRREKTDFAPAKSYLDVICAIPVQTFNYIDQNKETDDGLTLGVVAQDVQAVAPELVAESNWGTKEEPKMRLSIYQTDLQYALMKCIQEQQALITQLQADVATLKGAA